MRASARSLAADAVLVTLAASAPVAIELVRGLAHAGGDLEFMFIPHFAWWWSRPHWLGGWNPWIFGGFPSNADPLVGHVHPLGLLWAVLSPLAASAAEGAAAPALAGLGMLLYLRSIGAGRTGSVVGALAFACGGYVHAHAVHPEKLRSALAIPWALAAIEALDGRRLVAGLGVATGVLIAGGHPQTIVFALGLVVVYGAVFGSGRRGAIGAGLLAGIALPAVTWLPALELVARSNHVRTLIVGIGHMGLACAPALVVPFGCGGGQGPFYGRAFEAFPGCGIINCTGYPGMLVWLLVLAGMARVAASSRGRFWLVVAVAGLVLSTDVTERVLPIPGVRAPSRALLWWSMAIAAAAAIAIGPDDDRVRRGRAWWIATLVLAGVVAWMATRGPVAERAAAGSALVLVATALVTRTATHWPAVLVLAADLVVFGAELHAGVPPPVAAAARVELRRIDAALDGSDGRAIAVPGMHDPMWAQVERVPMLQGWNVLVPTAFSRLLAGTTAPVGYDFALVQDPALFDARSAVLDLLRARVVLVRRSLLADPTWAAVFADARWQAGEDTVDWRYYRNARARPVAWLVHRVRVVSDDEALALVRGERAGFDPTEEALATEPLSVAPGSSDGGVEAVARDEDRIVLRASTAADALVVTSELAYPGWTATVDGRDVPVRTVNAGFRAVEVPAGTHEVVLAYRPVLGRVGLALGVLGLVAVIACALPRRQAARG